MLVEEFSLMTVLLCQGRAKSVAKIVKVLGASNPDSGYTEEVSFTLHRLCGKDKDNTKKGIKMDNSYQKMKRFLGKRCMEELLYMNTQ